MKKILMVFLFWVFAQSSVMAQACYSSSISDPSPFMGTGQETVTLMDGSKWKITDYTYLYLYAYYPSVTICPSTGKLTVGVNTFNVTSASTVVVTPTTYTFRICNQSNEDAIAAYARFDSAVANATFSSHGWYNIAAGACSNVSVTTTRYRYYYVYAASRNLTWPSAATTFPICIDPVNAFNITGTTNCVGRGYVERFASEVDTGATGTTYTLNLTGTGSSVTADADKVFAWAERTYSTLFTPANGTTQTIPGYRYRAYSGGSFLAVNDTGVPHLLYIGPLSGGALLDLGMLATWLAQAGP